MVLAKQLSFSEIPTEQQNLPIVFLLITAKVKKTKCMETKWPPILELALVLVD